MLNISDAMGAMGEIVRPFRNLGRYVICPKETKALMKGEHHAPCANYAGPGTQYKLRAQRGDKPTSNGDMAAMAHDKAFDEIYDGIKNGTMSKEEASQKVREADDALIATIKHLNRHSPEGNKLFTNMTKQLIVAKKHAEDLGLLDRTAFVT